MPKPSKPEIELAVAGQKAKASTYNDNFQTMLDYVDDCMDYAALADLSNLDATGEAHFLSPNIGVRRGSGSAVGSSNRPVYVTSGGVATACSGLDSNMRCTSRTSIGTTKPDMVIAQGGSGTSGYRVWASGFKECWGVENSSSAVANVKVTFAMDDYFFSTTPIILTSAGSDNAYNTNNSGTTCTTGPAVTYSAYINRPSETEFYIARLHDRINWYAFGY